MTDRSTSRILRAMSPEYIEKMNMRLYCEDFKAHKERHKASEAKLYPTAPPKTLSTAAMHKSVMRLSSNEMEQRAQNSEKLQKELMFKGPRKVKGLEPSDMEVSVHRLYKEACKHKEETMALLEDEYTWSPKPACRLDKETKKELSERLSRPKRRDLTEEEINKILEIS